MTQEEKAKRYDEAKALMSKAWNDNRCTLGFMNEIFPELKESEDERIRKALIKIVNGIYQDEVDYAFVEDGISYEQLFSWLEKQGEQKTVKWSEEDEKMRNNIITGLEMLRDTVSSESLVALYNKKIDWLKSLRPQNRWKPSDEQIIALRWVLNNVPYNKQKEEISGLLDRIKDL